MQREIKFRAWIGDRKALKEVVRYEKHDNGFSVSYLDSIGNEIAPMYSNSHSIELMQYTGKKDKNGFEIYEGDIVKWGKDTELNERIAKVVFDELGVRFISVKNGTFYLHSFIYADTKKHLEVIGNIYENADLLKG